MPLVTVALAVVVLLILIGRFKFNAFLALILSSFSVGMLNGMPVGATLESILKGIGSTMGSLALVLAFGAMLGKLIEESGAAHTITYSLIDFFGLPRIQLAILLTGFLVGLPMIYNASFLVLIPLIYTFSTTTGLPLMYLGIPLSASLSVAHGYLPPHPAPTTVAVMYKADPNLTLLYGILVAIPAIFLGGPVLSLFFRKFRNSPPEGLYVPREFKREELPGMTVSVFTTLIPVLLMLAGAVVTMTCPPDLSITTFFKFLSDPNVALLLAVLVGSYTLGIRRGKKMDAVMKSLGDSVASVSMILLIIAAGGAFKQVLLDAKVGDYMAQVASSFKLSPLLLAWSTAALLRVSLGSATVATITAAGIVLPTMAGTGVRPELMVLATGSGSLMLSHFNDVGFWMFKEYYNLDIKHTFLIWTTMESIVGLAGLGGVLLLNAVL
jgi:Gnt-I system high-affinity gluconate transporter/Gnt-II system L-idonate transporter